MQLLIKTEHVISFWFNQSECFLRFIQTQQENILFWKNFSSVIKTFLESVEEKGGH